MGRAAVRFRPAGSLPGVRRARVGTVVVTALAAVLLAGCDSGGDGSLGLAVTTPPASATAAGPTSAAPTPAPTSGPTAAPTSADPSDTGPASTYAALVADWQRARSVFFAAVSDGSARPVAQQRALATAFLTAQRRFAGELRAYAWPAGARPAVTALLGRNAAQQGPLAAMAGAGSAGEFTGRLADYGVGAGPENRALAAVSTALN